MRISFRQGIVRAPANFLQEGVGSVTLSVPANEAVVVAIADGTSNYLITEQTTVANAWTGLAGVPRAWLYWDINQMTGQRTFGFTTLEPAEGPTPPIAPANDQHWFDTTIFKMRVWNATLNTWQNRIRVFAADKQGDNFISISINSPSYLGTQVGSVPPTPVDAGALVFDADGRAIRRPNGTFFTTEDVVLTGVANSSQIKLAATVLEAEALVPFPAYTVVRWTGFEQVDLATDSNVETSTYGITQQSAVQGDIVSVISEGLVVNPSWDFTSVGVNAAVFVDQFGAVTTTAPTPTSYSIGTVIARDAIILRQSPAVATSGGGTGTDLPPLGSPHQILAVKTDGTGLTYKTVQGINSVTITNADNTLTISVDTLDCGQF